MDILVENVSETQALRLEAELISALGTEETGGPLTNSVVPAGVGSSKHARIVVPQGSIERAQLGLDMLKSAVEKLIEANPDGITNSDTASLLGLRSDYRGRQKDYLSYSVLGLLLRERRVVRREGNPPRHTPPDVISFRTDESASMVGRLSAECSTQQQATNGFANPCKVPIQWR